MKKLGIALAIVTLLLAGTALAAETPSPDKTRPVRSQGKPGEKRPDFKQCDKDNDGALTREEFTACYPKWAERFDALDADKDGKVTREEMRAHREARKLERRKAFFEACDTNKDGQLNFEEFSKCSDDRQARMHRDKKDRPQRDRPQKDRGQKERTQKDAPKS